MLLRLLICLFPLLLVNSVYAADSCTALQDVRLLNTTIVGASLIPAGTQVAINGRPDKVSLPAFCWVIAQLTPTADSSIHMELWLPVNWNRSFRGQGNEAFAGSIDYASLIDAVTRGYATAATDTGHTGNPFDATWALQHPEKVADFGYRAIHLMTQTSQQLIRSYYSTPAQYSFFSSCSNGGREALMEAERFPNDYDGIIAGDPAYNWIGVFTNFIANANTLNNTPGGYIPAAKLPLINTAVLQACGTPDEIRHGFLTDPRTCRFDPQTIACKAQAQDDNSCLNQAQIKSLQTLYAGTSTVSGALVAHGYLPGGELGPNGWAGWITGTAPGNSGGSVFGVGYFANMVYANPQWTPQFSSAEQLYWSGLLTTGLSLNATNPNLIPFFLHGGKLILYHGWNDPGISPLSTIDYFNLVNVMSAPFAAHSMRLYMVPGMQHCVGGPGPTYFGQTGLQPGQGPDDPQHDIQLAMEQWVRLDAAPQAIIASQYDVAPAPGAVTLTRPLCPYPQVAAYQGWGDTNDAANFACAVPKPPVP